MFGKPKEKSEFTILPMVPIRDVVLFPYMMIPFVIGRPASVKALELAFNSDKRIFLATQHDAVVDDPRPTEIYSTGTIGNIVQSLRLPDGNIKVLVEGVERGQGSPGSGGRSIYEGHPTAVSASQAYAGRHGELSQ